jgi:phosphoenolpyruvate-protein phosphotransferase
VSLVKVTVLAPMEGWCMPLAEVPDEVFAQGMAGEGVAIDPCAGVVLAPFDGEIVPMQGAKHAVTVRSAGGVDILVHVGIDTVRLGGEGFEALVAPGQRVRAGEALLRFDLDLVARKARSAVTPILVVSGGKLTRRIENRLVKAGEVLMEIEAAAASAAGTREESRAEERRFRVPFDHGLHVRPAALIAAALRPFTAEVTIAARGRSGNARSTVAMMSLGVHCGETIEVRAVGADAASAVAALESLLAPEMPAALQEAARPRAGAAPAARIEGLIASRGMAVGPAARWSQPEIPVAEEGVSEAGEAKALADALAFMRDHLASLSRAATGEQQELLQAHAELVQDPELLRAAHGWLARGKSAAYAWRQATRALAQSLATLGDARMRERAADLRDLESQVVRVMRGDPPAAARELPAQAIVIADDLLPSQLMALDPARIAGICIARGGATSHVAIIAAAAGIPTLVAAGPGILEVAEGTPLVLDAEHGWIDIDPPAAALQAAQRAAVQRAVERTADLAAAREPASTRDGVRIGVKANVGSLAEARAAVESGAEGCGLLRTEFLFLDRREPPAEEEQARQYQAIATAFEGRPVNVRTLDIGGDKPIAYLPLPREDNPALGLRGIRASLWRPDLMRTQLRAIMSVAPAGPARILLPMVNDVEELQAVRALVIECARELGLAAPPLGVMIETPAAAILAGQLALEADFLSLGTNDLAQYALAIDRGHAELGKQLDPLHPAVLRLIALVADAGRAAGKPVSVCGAMGSDVDALPILIGLGVGEVSATPGMIPRLKRMVRSLDAGECRELARRALEQRTAAAVRDLALQMRARARASAQSTPGD